METQPVWGMCPILSATSPRWPLESPAREPIPTGCSFSNWPMQSATLTPGSSKTRSCLKLGRYDAHSYEAFQKKFELVAEANGWDEAERVGQLAAALDGDAQQVLMEVRCIVFMRCIIGFVSPLWGHCTPDDLTAAVSGAYPSPKRAPGCVYG